MFGLLSESTPYYGELNLSIATIFLVTSFFLGGARK
jgi:hypothetical protein